MGIFDRLFNRTSKNALPVKTPVRKPNAIKTQADVRAFFIAATADERLGKLLAEVADQTGRDGYLAIERGGTGEPYSVELMPCPEDNRSLSVAEVRQRIADLRQQIAATASLSERDPLEKQLALLAGGVCTLYIGSSSSVDYRNQRETIRKVWAEFKEIVNKQG